MPDHVASPAAVGRSVRQVAGDLGFVEGPTLTAAGLLVVVSIDRSLIDEIDPADRVRVLAETEGAPNGATEGLDGALYVTHFWGAWPADLSRNLVLAAHGTDHDPQSTVQRYSSSGMLADVLLSDLAATTPTPPSPATGRSTSPTLVVASCWR